MSKFTLIWRKFFCAITVSLIILAISPLARAVDLSDPYKKRDYYSELQELAKKQRQQKEKDAKEVEKQIASVSARIEDTEDALKSTSEQLEATDQEIEHLSKEIKTEEENLAREKDKLNNVINVWYMAGPESFLTTLFSAKNLSELFSGSEYYNTTRQQITLTMEKIAALKEKLNLEKAEKDRKALELSDLQKTQEAQKSDLERKKEIKKGLLSNTQKAIAELREEEKKAAQLEQEALSEIARIIASRRKAWILQKGKGQKVNAGDVVGTMGSTGNSSGPHLHFEVRTAEGDVVNPRDYLGSTFIWPTSSRRVTQEFGMTDYARAGAYGGSIHTGLDVGALEVGVWGDPIFTAGPGEIVYKDWRGAYGYAVVVLHDNNMITLYAHLGGIQ